MSRKKSKVIVLDRPVLNSKAFRSLTGVAPIIFLDFLGKRKMGRLGSKKSNKWRCLNNGEIEYTYTEALKKGISKPRFCKGIDQLVDNGLIDISHSGGGYDGDKSLYAISDRWRKYGTGDFEEVKRPKDTRQGIGFAAVHARKREKEGTILEFKPRKKLKKIDWMN